MSGETNELLFPDYEGWLDDNEERFLDADLMPDDGPNHQVNSNFQIRRRAQIKLLQEAFANCFPGWRKLSRLEAKRMLIACSNSSLEAATYIVHAATYNSTKNEAIDSPPEYILTTITNQLNAEQNGNTLLVLAEPRVRVTEVVEEG